jgi:phosphate transport system substrate-binding protein
MRRALSILVAATTIFSLSACKRAGSTDPAGGAAGASGSAITVAGSNSMLPFVESWAEQYTKKFPERKVNVQGGGSTAGVKGASTGAADIGDVSRDLKPEETGLEKTVVARDGISVVVARQNPVSALTLAQVKGIFTGKTKSWKELGGEDKPITVITREEGSGARGAFEELALDKEHVSASAIVVDSTGGIREMVKTDANAIAFGTMGQMNGDVKALKLNGADATEANVANGSYPLVHPFLMVTRGAPKPAAKDFIDFVLSAEGQALVRKEGLISPK